MYLLYLSNLITTTKAKNTFQKNLEITMYSPRTQDASYLSSIVDKRPSKMLRISSVADIRQMPAGTQKQPHTSKLAVAVYYAPLCAYLIAFAHTIEH